MPYYTVYKLVLVPERARPSFGADGDVTYVQLFTSTFVPQGLVQAATAEDALAKAKRAGHFAPAVELQQGGLQ
jgi:hypothetical protein